MYTLFASLAATLVATGRRLMRPKVFFTAVAQPNSKRLWNLLFLSFGELIVEYQGAMAKPLLRRIALPPTGSVAVRIPQPLSRPNSASGLFDQRFSF